MALIKCSECGKEISDKASACIYCGCPASAMKTQPENQANSTQTKRTVVSQNIIDGVIKDMFYEPKPVPTEMPEPGFWAGMLLWLVNKLCGICGLAGIGSLGMMLVDAIKGYGVDIDMLPTTAAALAGAWILSELHVLIEFGRAKRFIRKNGYENSIRRDSTEMTNSLNAFKLYPCKAMAKYIGKLNPKSGTLLQAAIANSIKNKRKERLAFLPYLLILLVMYYVFPDDAAEKFYLYQETLVILHVVTLILMTIYGYKQNVKFSFAVVTAVLFVPTILAYYDSDMWYHILICGAAAFVGMNIGMKISSKKK